MKKIAIISLLLLVCPLIRAIEYTVDKVPNVHLDDGRRFVSNPDGILSAETVNTLDQMLFSLQEANTSEVAVVALQSIGDNSRGRKRTYRRTGKKRNRLGENHRYIPHGFPRRISHFVICHALEHSPLC